MRVDITRDELEQSTMTRLVSNGAHNVQIITEEEKLSSTGSRMLILTYKVVGNDPDKGLEIRDTFCLFHSNQDAVRVARSRLARLAAAAGMSNLEDTRDLMNRLVKVTTEQEQSSSDGKTYTNVRVKRVDKADENIGTTRDIPFTEPPVEPKADKPFWEL